MHQSVTLPPQTSSSVASSNQADSTASWQEIGSVPISTDATQSNQRITQGPDTISKIGTGALQGTESLSTIPTAPASGWFSWLSRYARVEETRSTPDVPILSTPSDMPNEDDGQQPSESPGNSQREASGPAAVSRPANGSMWSYLWFSDTRASTATVQPTAQSCAEATGPAARTEGDSRDCVMEDAPSSPIPVPVASSASNGGQRRAAGTPGSAAPGTASAGSTWAFWSRDTRPRIAGKPSNSLEQGEIAVIGDRSEADPKPATGVEVRGPPSMASSLKDVPSKASACKDAPKKDKRLRTQSMDARNETPSSSAGPKPEVLSKSDSTSSKQAAAAKLPQARAKALPANLLLPSFQSTYHLKENTSILRQMTRFMLRAHQPPASHLFLTTEPPKIKKAVAIGVHGLFPATYLRPMIGQPTGTSIRFANHGAEAVRRWADAHGCHNCEIEKIALEGEGKISERVDNLWKLLLNWVDHIRSADLILLACHSQGVPVGIMLLAKLIDLGIAPRARIGVCAMGTSHYPPDHGF